MRESELFNNLNIFFRRFQGDTDAGAIKIQFLDCLKGMGNRTGICDELESLKSVYEAAVRLTEKETAAQGFPEDLLSLQRDLYRELEYLLAFEHADTRHHFLVVIPVADRPIMLKNCLESLVEQCRVFQYGEFTINPRGAPVFHKISAVIIDDSSDEENILKIKDICSETDSAGIRTYYVGLDEQTELLAHLPSGHREELRDLIGENHKRAQPHKGASISRNIAYLYLRAFSATMKEKILIYFLDSDEEFTVKIKRGSVIEDIPFINYFYWLDRLFETSAAEVVTGKVVGDPPVSPSVMINTFLDDILLFFETMSSAVPKGECIFHDDRSAGDPSPGYHDMVKLFGYNDSQGPRKYCCSLQESHTVRDCLDDFSKRALGFFYGLHPTRTQFYLHRDNFTEVDNARTVYTGNYVFNTAGFRHFIPFANLKLRMAGPALGRILKKRLKHRFISANLPLLHKRTIQTSYGNEFRSGIVTGKNSIDLSLEFNRQFWGDVMLFTVEKLAEFGYPDKRLGLSEITKTAYDIQDKLWDLYKERQAEIAEKTGNIRNYLCDNTSWWNRESGTESAVETIRLFCSLVENNFGTNSVSLKKISEQIGEGASIKMIINAIHSFYEIDIAWNDLLKAVLPVPLNSAADCSPIFNR
jgi:glycosyltransferase involved in cell wall biosynthesis